MRDRPGDKMRRPARDKGRAGLKPTPTDDFTDIPGVPEFASRALHDQGVLTFEDLRRADLNWMHRPIRAAIERWRRGG